MRLFISYMLSLLFCATVCNAQEVTVQSKIDSIAILIGQQAHLSVEVSAKEGANVVFPHFKRSQYYVPGVEVLEETSSEPVVSDGILKVSHSYTLTSFDEKLYPLPGIKVKVNGKVYTSNQLALKVVTCDVDTLHPVKFFPPKDVQDNPFMWSEWTPLIWSALAVIVLCLAFAYLLQRLKHNKPIIAKIRIVKVVPPHQKALNEIENLKKVNFEPTDDQKEYYTKLTEALRKYIKERFGFNAMEMTSSEIIMHLKANGDESMMNELQELFMTADLVKFAKYSSLLNEKDMNLVNAINFIDKTKRDDVPTEEKIMPTLSDDEKKTNKNHMVITSLLWLIGIAAFVLVVYIVYNAWLLLE